MPIVVNTNTSATTASFNLSRANEALRKSLGRLSSGNRITSPADDAGGLAVAYKMESVLKRTEAVRINVQNGLSFLQVQDGGLKVIGKILDRMSELRTYSDDITKSTSDTENYSKEFVELQQQLLQISREKFNGISLFSDQMPKTFFGDALVVYIDSTQTGIHRQQAKQIIADIKTPVVGYQLGAIVDHGKSEE